METLDCRGLRCPLPVLKARKRLRSLTPGAVLLVMSDDPLAALDLPAMVQEDGHHLLTGETRDGVFYAQIGRS
ncbi:MAG: sulfurtransferase TusA family protein [Hyphomicrobiaceae bacterium]|nr:sulfurtransferase TusA family protein [Hyphomicrobiaceae bacterium]